MMYRCIQGHPFTEKNTYVFKGVRRCRKCKNRRLAVYMAGP